MYQNVSNKKARLRKWLDYLWYVLSVRHYHEISRCNLIVQIGTYIAHSIQIVAYKFSILDSTVYLRVLIIYIF